MSMLRLLGTKILSAMLSVDAGPAYIAQRKVVSLTDATLTAITDAPPAGQIVVIDDLIITVDAAMTVDIKEETSGALIDRTYMPANGKAQITPRGYLKAVAPTVAKKAMAQLSGVANATIHCVYHFETPPS